MKAMSETGKSRNHLEGANKRKVVRITAQSFFDQMLEYGFDEEDIINFTTEILDLLIRKDGFSRPRSTSRARKYPVEYKSDSRGQVVEILGPDLSLSPLREKDLPILEKWREEESYRGTLIERIFTLGTEELFHYFSSERNKLFLVRLKSGAPLGFLTYQLDWTDPTRAELKKFLADKQQRGHGYGSQMTYLWLHYGFTNLNLRKISARTVDSNLVNINLNRKLGFRFEGYLSQEVRLRDSFVDVTVMSVLREQVGDLFEIPTESGAREGA